MECAACPREVVQQRVWEKVTPAQRAVWLAEGKTVLQGRGLCRACYLRVWKKARRMRVSLDAIA